MMFEDDEGKGEAKMTSKNKLPDTPSLDEDMVNPKRQNPFVLDNWGGTSPANTTKP